MNKIKIDTKMAFTYPMPIAIVGTITDGNKPNFMPVGWIVRVNHTPAMFAISLGSHYTNNAIEKNKEFSINIPDISLIEKTDYCGVVSGLKTDKSDIFEVFYGELKKAPLIKECPVSIGFTLHKTVELPSNTIYICKPHEIFTEEKYLTENKLDIKKINPFTLTMPDNNYWSIGEKLGKAWEIGLNLKNK